MRNVFFAIALAMLSAHPAFADSELDRVWTAGRLTWSASGRVETGSVESSAARATASLSGQRLPAVVYLQGCSGVDAISDATARFYAEAGFVVVSPDSFARANKPVSCDVATHRGGLHREALGWRQAEAREAVARVKGFPFVDPARVYLHGFSEGAIAAATVTGVSVRARIVEGWTCHSAWPEYVGVRAAASQKVLSFTSRDDPWFQLDATKGDCGSYLKGRPGSRSVVFEAPDALHDQHYVSWRADARATIMEFLGAR